MLENSSHLFYKILDYIRSRTSYLISICLLLILFFSFTVRYKATNYALPYLYYFDEPLIATDALNMMKKGDFKPNYWYGGTMYYSCLAIDVVHYYYLMGKLESRLNGVGDIKTDMEGHPRTISHPSFYHWSRIFVAILSTLTIYILYLIGSNCFNPFVGLLSALTLSISNNHFDFSYFTTVDNPVCLTICCCVLFGIMFNKSQKIKHLMWCTFFAGLSMATKNNAVVAIFIPLGALFINYKYLKYDKASIILITIILPFLIFLILNPYAILDMGGYLDRSGSILRTYKLIKFELGITPGKRQLFYQIGLVENDFTSILLVIGYIGFFMSLYKTIDYRNIFILMLFPVLYIILMIQQHSHYHRNYSSVYPFISLFIGYSIYEILSFIVDLQIFSQIKFIKYNLLFKTIIMLLVILGISDFVINRYITINERSDFLRDYKDNRTISIEKVNVFLDKLNVNNQKLPNIDSIPYHILPPIYLKFPNINIGIAKELRMSEADLRNLNCKYMIFDHNDILKAQSINDYLLVGYYKSSDSSYYKEDELLNCLTKQQKIIDTIKGNNLTDTTGSISRLIDLSPTISPTIFILKGK